MKYLTLIFLGILFSDNLQAQGEPCDCEFTTVTRSNFPAGEYVLKRTATDAVIRMDPQGKRNLYNCYGYANVCRIPAGTYYYQENSTGVQFIKACGNKITWVRDAPKISAKMVSSPSKTQADGKNITINNYNVNKNNNTATPSGSTGQGVAFYPASSGNEEEMHRKQLRAQRMTTAGTFIGPALGQIIGFGLSRIGGGRQSQQHYVAPPSRYQDRPDQQGVTRPGNDPF